MEQTKATEQIEQPQVTEATCPHCGYKMNRWQTIRYLRQGEWAKTPYGGHCFSCQKDEKGEVYVSKLKAETYIIDKVGFGDGKGGSIRKSQLKDIQSRVVTEEGQVLRGKEGLTYMKSNPDKYASRLKDYYK